MGWSRGSRLGTLRLHPSDTFACQLTQNKPDANEQRAKRNTHGIDSGPKASRRQAGTKHQAPAPPAQPSPTRPTAQADRQAGNKGSLEDSLIYPVPPLSRQVSWRHRLAPACLQGALTLRLISVIEQATEDSACGAAAYTGGAGPGSKRTLTLSNRSRPHS